MTNFATVSQACGIRYRSTDQHRDFVGGVGKLLRRQRQWAYEYNVWAFHVKVTEHELGSEHRSTISSMINLAQALRNLSKPQQADAIYQRTSESTEKKLGKDPPSTLEQLNGLAVALAGQGKYEQAEEIHRRILGSMERDLGKEHPSARTVRYNLAGMLRDQGKKS
ncbi:uncharacterized protein A1O9_08642 [Exophiala aquamarina CBS 119918]|uniref:Kinesin light chain n=1 Tax=Exophiala aquamarina CBS 119918 TaxID=1182545 RepID=A0A072PHH0_9EURO|nr:uncharacterized protein A1O9_08642 [Exophiala aquamarina CBS 119918]KEF54990.1 hypothetical protein A1O9_08642 [Exophiala aquamarina CBS 119918]